MGSAKRLMSLKVVGLNKLAKRMERVSKRMRDKEAAASLRKGAVLMARAIRTNAKRIADPGRTEGKHLHQSIGRRTKKYRKGSTIFTAVGPRWRDAPHAHFVEFGHRMVVGGTVERITGKQAGKAPKSKREGLTGKGRLIGQVPPSPFMRPAFDSTAPSATSAIERDLLGRLRRTVQAIGKGGR